MTGTEEAVDARSIAGMLGISRDTAYRKAKLGEIPSFKIGNRLRFFPDVVRDHFSKAPDPTVRSARTRNARRKHI